MIRIRDSFWSPKQALNRSEALLYQWQQYEKCGTTANFRLAADGARNGRQGFFYTDSDLHKWADAVCRVLAREADAALSALLDDYIALMAAAQHSNGYLFTWNQIYFPGQRWRNLQVEHELYTAGHFIEAGIAHFQATGSERLLAMARKMADLIVADFTEIQAQHTPGHQEVELALIKLYQCTGQHNYLETAQQFLQQRGRHGFFALTMLREVVSHTLRAREVTRAEAGNAATQMGFEFAENIQEREPRFIMLRSLLAFANGSYQQQHKPLLEQIEPQGHSVRWAYMMHALALLANELDNAAGHEAGGNAVAEQDNDKIRRLLKASWEHLVDRKMYITGGIGALPVIEGFGRDYELDNEFSYSETCAAIGSVFWNNELLKLQPQARYADLIERQLYNAAAVGISEDGKRYFYRNPLQSNGTLARHAWFETACCPSNISRLWADIDKLIFLQQDQTLYINQYIGCTAQLSGGAISVEMASAFPWQGDVSIKLRSTKALTLKLRIPGWAQQWSLLVNGEAVTAPLRPSTASDYTQLMHAAYYQALSLEAGKEYMLVLQLPMAVIANEAPPQQRNNRGKIALSRGPLLYCAESEADIVEPIASGTLQYMTDEQSFSQPAGTLVNEQITLIPYYLWGNRGQCKMKLWLTGT